MASSTAVAWTKVEGALRLLKELLEDVDATSDDAIKAVEAVFKAKEGLPKQLLPLRLRIRQGSTLFFKGLGEGSRSLLYMGEALQGALLGGEEDRAAGELLGGRQAWTKRSPLHHGVPVAAQDFGCCASASRWSRSSFGRPRCGSGCAASFISPGDQL